MRVTTRRTSRTRRGGATKKRTFNAVIKHEAPWWIGWIEEVPGVNCQERTRQRLVATLRITLAEALEMNRDDARRAAGDGFEEFPLAV